MSNTLQQWTFTSRARRDRRSLVPLAALVGVALVATAVLGLFGQHYGHKGYVEEAREVDRLVAALDGARQAQVHFKVQVQEWKNILLRGHQAEDFALYRSHFETEEAAVRTLLGGLDGDEPRRLLAAHRDLGMAYRAALTDSPASGPRFDPIAIDSRVRGLDRAFNTDIDALADSIRATVDAVRAASAEANRQRFETLRTASLWGLALCVGLVILFLLAVMRADRERA